MLLVALLLGIASAPHAGDGLPFQWIGGQHSNLHNTALTGDTIRLEIDPTTRQK